MIPANAGMRASPGDKTSLLWVGSGTTGRATSSFRRCQKSPSQCRSTHRGSAGRDWSADRLLDVGVSHKYYRSEREHVRAELRKLARRLLVFLAVRNRRSAWRFLPSRESPLRQENRNQSDAANWSRGRIRESA